MSIAETLLPVAPPLQTDVDGVIRVGGTRVTLDTVVSAYEDGETSEEIALQYDSLSLADIHAVISYYLRNSAEVAAYLQERRKFAATVRKANETQFPAQGIRERLLARHPTGEPM